MGWVPGQALSRSSVIEVYPAGTLAARDLPRSGYKGSGHAASSLRRELTSEIAKQISFDAQAREQMVETDHVLDAVLCVCAGLDFLSGNAVAPEDLSLAKREGWIWVASN